MQIKEVYTSFCQIEIVIPMSPLAQDSSRPIPTKVRMTNDGKFRVYSLTKAIN